MKNTLPLLVGLLFFAAQNIRAADLIADVTLTTEAVAAATVPQNSTNNVAYILRLDVATEAVTLTNFSMTTSGTYDANDLNLMRLRRNTTPAWSGGTNIGFDNSLTGNGETVSFNSNQTFAIGTHYLLVTVDVDNAATDGNTVHLDGGTNPASLTFSTAPNLTNNQSNAAGALTFEAADVTLTTEAVAAAIVSQNSTNNLAYILRLDVATEAVTLTNFSMTTSGTYDADDLDRMRLRRNSTPAWSGGTDISSDNSFTGNGEAVSFITNQVFATGTHYLLVTVDVDKAATDGNTVHLEGGTNSASLTFFTAPNLTDNQSNLAGALTFEAADVTLTTEAVAAAIVSQNSTNNLAYILRLDVATEAVTLTNFSMTTSGTYDSDDLDRMRLRRNSTPAWSGGTDISSDNSLTGNGEAVSVITNQVFAIGTHYLLVTVDVDKAATDGNTVHLDGGANPASLTFFTAPNLTNNQSNLAGALTFQAADVTYTTEAVVAATVPQNSTNNVAYILRLDVATEAVTLANFSMTTSGTYDADDLNLMRLRRNTIPAWSGGTNIGFDNSLTGNGETVSFNSIQTFAIGTHYLLVTVDVDNAATHGHTVHLDGGANPASLTFSTAPNLTNNQSNLAGALTFEAADVTYTTEVVAAATVSQNSTNNVAYILRLDVATEAVTLANFSMTTSGTYDADDLNLMRLRRNTTPTWSGGTNIGLDASLTGNGETVSFNSIETFAIGTHYLLVTVDVDNAATHGHTVHLDGGANPASLTFSTAPNRTNNQSSLAGALTFEAADVTYTTEVVPATIVSQNSTNNVAYILRLDVATLSVVMNAMSIVTSGTYDASDLERCRLWRNTSPDLTGALNIAADFTLTGGAGETVVLNPGSQTFAIGTHYLIFTVDVDAAADLGHTVHFNGATNPAVPGFTTAPNTTDGQSDNAGVQTLGAPLPIELTTFHARVEAGHNQLTWTTAGEADSDRFVVERSEDGRAFRPLGSVAAAGFSLEKMDYSFGDFSPPANAYYRLRMIDFDGSEEFSPTVFVRRRVGLVPRVFPTVFFQKIFLKNVPESAAVTVFDAAGRPVWSGSGAGSEVDLAGLPAGVFYVKIFDDNLRLPVVERVVKR